MSTESNRAIVLEFYGLMSKLKFDSMFDLMADQGTWTVAGNPNTFHHAGTATKAQRAAALANFTKVFSSLEMDIRSTTAEDDRVTVEIITTCRTRSGLTYKNELLVLVRLRQDKIVSIYEHLDQQTSLEFERLLQTTAQPAQCSH
jgi:ketosteroid isomerase-like protein